LKNKLKIKNNMFPKWHILFGAIFSLILFLVFKVNLFYSIVVFLASVLIDVDHYLFYVKRKDDWNLKTAFNWFVALEKKHKPLALIFHNIEFVILILILSFFHNFFLFILIGLLFHLSIDLIYLIVADRMGTKEFLLTRYLLNKDKSKYL